MYTQMSLDFKNKSFLLKKSNISIKDYFVKAKEEENKKNYVLAGDYYEKGGYFILAMKSYEKAGMLIKGYEAAKNDNKTTADIFTSKYNITGHIYSQLINGLSLQDFIKTQFYEGGPFYKLGFKGFNDKNVLDIGGRDGRYLSVFKDLGAKKVFLVDPDKESVELGIDSGNILQKEAFISTFQGLHTNIKREIDIGIIFNFSISIEERKKFFKDLYFSTKNNFELIITIYEDGITNNVLSLIEEFFIVKNEKINNNFKNSLHNNILYCVKKPSILVAIDK